MSSILNDQEIAPFEQLYNFVYTDKYEDPYAQFSEEVPTVELETAAFSDDVVYRVRAWNTMYSHLHMHASIYVNHF